MTDRPLLFSAPMILALWDGRKTQTRRVLKLPTKGQYVRPDMGGWEASTIGGPGVYRANGSPAPEQPCVWHQTTGTVVVSKFAIGDRIWVRETGNWRGPMKDHIGGGDMGFTFYAADSERGRSEFFDDKNKPGIFMPRSSSRLTLIITEVRMQRVQEISTSDSISEGADCDTCIAMARSACNRRGCFASLQTFRDLWDTINGKRAGCSWSDNPFVVALTFTVVQRNIDAVALP